MVKLAGHERLLHRGPARVFDSEEACFEAEGAQHQPGDVVVIRYEGRPRPGACAGDAARHRATRRRGPRRRGSARHGRALLGRHARAHGRPRLAGGGARRPARSAPGRGHPRRRRRGARAPRGALRRRARSAPARMVTSAPRYAQGVFAKYAALVSSASEGAVTAPAVRIGSFPATGSAPRSRRRPPAFCGAAARPRVGGARLRRRGHRRDR